jgi:hypothetical protein
MEHSLHHKVKVVVGIEPVVHTADAPSAIVDTKGFESLEWVITVGVAIDGDFTTVLEESDVVTFGGEETAVSAAETLGTLPVLTIADADKVYRVGVIGKKRFQKITLVEGSANTTGIVGANAILGHPKNAPTDAQFT